jgi:spore coat polysaccharide biosynthesis predicted glycosyltransferase SpsG
MHVVWRDLDAQIYVETREIGRANDMTLTLRHARDFEADWIVVDGYNFGIEWLDALGEQYSVLCLDDLGDRNAAVRLMLNQNAGAEQRYMSAYNRCGRALLGLDWFLLRREWREVQHVPESRRLMLTLGGEDPDNRMLELMSALLADGRPFIADVVSSASEESFQRAMAMALEWPDRFIMHRGPVALPPLLRLAAVVVSGGGVTSIEVASQGVASVIVILAENQKPGAEYLAAAGAVRSVVLGDGAEFQVAQLALDLLDDDMARSNMALRGCAMVDGNGSKRVMATMMDDRR